MMSRRRGRWTRPVAALLLAVLMCLGMVPAQVSAAGTEAVPEDGAAALAGGTEAAGTEATGAETGGTAEAVGAGVGNSRFRVVLRKAARAVADVPSGSYEVGLEWIGGNRYCTLTEDKTKATWNFEGATDASFINDDGHMNGLYDFRIVLAMHDTRPEDFELKIPAVFYSRQYAEDDYEIKKGYYVEYAIDEQALTRTLAAYEYLSLDVPSGQDKNAEDRYYTLRLNAQVSIKMEIPVVVRAYKLSGRTENARREADRLGFLELSDDAKIGVTVTEKDGREHSVTGSVQMGLAGLESGARTTGWWSGYKGGRVYEWTPNVGTYYGVTREAFDEAAGAGYVFFEHHFTVSPSGWTEGRLALRAVPSGLGEAVSMKLAYEAYEDKLIGDPFYSQDGTDGVVFDVCSPWWGGGMRSRRYSMLTGRTWFGTWGNPLYVNVLVKYPVSEVLDEDGGMTNVSCELSSELSNGAGDTLTDTARQAYSERYVNPHESAPGYFVGRIGSMSDGSDQLFWFENGVTEMGLTLDFFNGGATHSVDGEALLSTGLLGVSAYDPSTKEWVELGAEDYWFRKLDIERVGVGRPIYDADGNIVAYDDSELPNGGADHPVSVEYISGDDPDEWKTWFSSTYGSLKSDVTAHATEMNSMHITRLRFVDRNRPAPVDIRYRVWTMIGSTSSRMQKLLAHVKEAGVTRLHYEFTVFTSATSADGAALCVTGDDKRADDRIKDMSGRLLGGEGYGDAAPCFIRAEHYIASDGIGTGMSLVPTLYGSDGKALAAYYDGPVTGYVTAVDWLVVSWPSINPSGLPGLDPPEDSLLRGGNARYRILVPDGMDVASVRPGACGALAEGWPDIASRRVDRTFYGTSWGDGWTHTFSNYEGAIRSCSLDYEVVEDYNGTGHTVLLVNAKTPYEKSGRTPCFGGFTVRLQPKDSNFVRSSEDLRLDAAGYFVTDDGRTFLPGNGYADDGAYSDKDVFDDLDGDGDRTEKIVARHAVQCQILYQPTISGTYLSVSDPETKLSGSGVTVQPEGEYVYRMTYSQMASRSRDVVLFDVLEDLEGNPWAGTLKSIDTSDADRQGLACTVYVNRGRLDSQACVDANVTEKDLAEGRDGWTVYRLGDDLSGVTAVAVGFGSQEFAKDEAGKPSMVSVRLVMAAPGADGLSKDRNTVRNRSFYSDVLIDGTEQARTVMANVVTVGIDPEQLSDPYSEFELPKTGGAGTRGIVMAGTLLMASACACLAVRKHRRWERQ